MAERVNKLYRPMELTDAAETITQCNLGFGLGWLAIGPAYELIKELHKRGYRVTKVQS